MMRPHSLAFILSLGFFTLSCPSFVASQHEPIRSTLKANEGYLCGRRVYGKEFLEKSAALAYDRAFNDILSNLEVDDSSYPRAYKGDLKFNEDKLFLWPLSEEGESSLITANHFVILKNDLLSIVSVIQKQGSKEEKCNQEADISDMQGFLFATGYRCPFDIFTFETIDYGIQDAKDSDVINLLLPKPWKAAYPKYFPESEVFRDGGEYFVWPTKGNQNFRVAVSIILNLDFSLRGLIHQRGDEYVRCKITASHKIIPKFIGQAKEQQPKIVDRGSVDVFKCGHQNYIFADQVLKSVSRALPRFVANRQRGRAKSYPLPYNPSTIGAPKYLYLWPMRINEKGHDVECTQFGKYESFLVIIDYFSDVHGLLMRFPKGDPIECQRIAVASSFFEGISIPVKPVLAPAVYENVEKLRKNSKRIRIN